MKCKILKEGINKFLEKFNEPLSVIRAYDETNNKEVYTLIDRYAIYDDTSCYERDELNESKYNLGFGIVPAKYKDGIVRKSSPSYRFERNMILKFEDIVNKQTLKEAPLLLKTVLNYYSYVAEEISLILNEVEFEQEGLRDRLVLEDSLDFISYARDCKDTNKVIEIIETGLTGYYISLRFVFDIVHKNDKLRFLFMAPFKYLYDGFNMKEDLINKVHDFNYLEELPENPYSYLALYLDVNKDKYDVDLYVASEENLTSNLNNISAAYPVIVVGFVPIGVLKPFIDKGDYFYIEFFNNIINTITITMRDKGIFKLDNSANIKDNNQEIKKALLLLDVITNQLKD